MKKKDKVITALAILKNGEVKPIYDWSKNTLAFKSNVVELFNVASSLEEFSALTIPSDIENNITYENYKFTILKALRENNHALARAICVDCRINNLMGINERTDDDINYQ